MNIHWKDPFVNRREQTINKVFWFAKKADRRKKKNCVNRVITNFSEEFYAVKAGILAYCHIVSPGLVKSVPEKL